MLFFKSNVVRLQIVVLVSSLLLITGCFSAFPETPHSELPRATEVDGKVVPQTEGRAHEAVAGEVPEQLPDRQSLAEYQLGGGDTKSDRVETRRAVADDVMPNQISDRQSLAEYQLHSSHTDLGRAEDPESAAINALPHQLSDRQDLAEYQFHLSGGNLGR